MDGVKVIEENLKHDHKSVRKKVADMVHHIYATLPFRHEHRDPIICAGEHFNYNNKETQNEE